jgi:hypothetical protein
MKQYSKRIKKTFRKKVSKRKTKKIFKKTRKNVRYGGDIMENTYVKDKIVKYLNGLQTSDSTTNINEKCITPDSKGGQVISICGQYVYKTPPADAKPFILVKGNVVYVNGYVMNLLIQSIIKNDTELSKRVECYSYLNIVNGHDIFKTLVGKRYQFDFDGEKCFSVENFIKVFNTKYSSNKSEELKTKTITTLVKWVTTMIQTLNLLWDKIQFHHCDPKAAQLFINGNWDNNELIVGDLDKVTFSINIDNQVYRVCLPQYGRETLNEKLSSTKNAVKNTLFSALNVSKKLFGSNKYGGLGTISFAELMRISTTPSPNNHRETAAFISSILLLIDDDDIRKTLFNNLSNSFNEYTELIDLNKLLQNHYPFEKRRSHKIACLYIKNLDTSLKSPNLQSQVSI